jgi:hypothetical protein
LKNQTPDAINLREETVMKRSALFQFALIGVTASMIHTADAGSAVATDSHGHNIYVFGHPEATCKRLALDEARRRGWANERIIAVSDVTGFGAIATARHPNGHGSMIGVALGMKSRREAYAVATKECLQAGGTNVLVKWSFKG